MKTSTIITLCGLAAIVAPAGAAAQGPSGRCTRETLSVDGAAIAASFCVTGENRGSSPPTLSVTESFRSAKGSLDRTISVDELPGTTASRTVDDVALDRLGSSKVLHVTLLQQSGTVSLEHALLLPGARVIK